MLKIAYLSHFIYNEKSDIIFSKLYYITFPGDFQLILY